MPIATNPDTGEVLALSDEGVWAPAKIAMNPQTGERLAFDGKGWIPAPPGKTALAQFFSQQAVPAGDLSASDVAVGAVKNLPSSLKQAGSDLIQPIIHPIDTVENIGSIGKGVLQKVGILSGSDAEKYADAVGGFFAERYGGWENIKRAIATDPIGVLADVSMVLTGGGTAAARAPGLVGKVGEVAKTVGRTVDPVNIAVNAAAEAGRAVAPVLGVTTGAGGKAIVEAAEAGSEGGARAQALRDNMRSVAPIDDVVNEARASVEAMRTQRSVEYRTAMANVGADQTVLDFAKIDQAVADVARVKKYKGQDLSPKTQAVRQEIDDAISGWRALDPADFHTPEGLDALKQKIGDIRDGAERGSPSRVIAEKVYGAVRQTIIDQVPEYAKVMKAYEEASALIKDIEQTLSVSPKANVDTAVRKLQSVLRNNVSTNYGRREVLAQHLVDAGAIHLLTKLAGQSLSAAAPRGVARIATSGAAIGGVGGFLSGLGLPALAIGAAALPVSSPRLVGEAAFAAGRASRYGRPAGQAAFQIGRESRLK